MVVTNERDDPNDDGVLKSLAAKDGFPAQLVTVQVLAMATGEVVVGTAGLGDRWLSRSPM